MDVFSPAIEHIIEVAKVPSFSSYEERLHPYIHNVFDNISGTELIDVAGNNILYKIPGSGDGLLALTAHIDKINHFGAQYPDPLPVRAQSDYLKGAMDDSAGVGILLAVAELTEHQSMPDLLFCFSEMEESKGLKERPDLIKNNGEGYKTGMGAIRIAQTFLEKDLIPSTVITIDTTPLFEGDQGIALYSRHWELNDLDPSQKLISKTRALEKQFLIIDDEITLDNNTNDYLHYGLIFNQSGEYTVPSLALEPSIYPYHQKGERVYVSDIKRTFHILKNYLDRISS